MSQLPFAKYDAEFRKDHPETIGETDQTFDLANYCEWLEKRIERLGNALDPFAHFAEAVVRFAEGPGNSPKSGPIYALHGHGLDEREITVEHFRAALTATMRPTA